MFIEILQIMKKGIIGFLLLLAVGLVAYSQTSKKESSSKDASNSAINWISFEEAEQKMKIEPRKVIVDVYTDWCGWCKVLDKKTYSNPELIEYVNKNFYAIKFNAEGKSPVQFLGKEWKIPSGSRINELATQLMNGRASYPTTVFLEEGFKNAQPVPGFLEVPQMESILKFFGENHHKSTQWNIYQSSFKPEWKIVSK